MIESTDYPVTLKKSSLQKSYFHSFVLAALLTTILVVLSTLTRIALLFKSASAVDFTFLNLLGIFGIGLFYDLVNAAYFILPLMIYIWLMSARRYEENTGSEFFFTEFSHFSFLDCFSISYLNGFSGMNSVHDLILLPLIIWYIPMK